MSSTRVVRERPALVPTFRPVRLYLGTFPGSFQAPPRANQRTVILAVTRNNFHEIFNLPSYVNFRILLMAHSYWWVDG